MRRIATLLLPILIALAAVAYARSWHVERDGSADYTVIQDAVDVAASGDTILIGPGRFNEQRYWSFPGWSDSVRVVVPQHELTFIGSGPATIIGQTEPWEIEQGYHKGIVTGDLLGNAVIRIEKIRFENMAQEIYTSYESTGEDTVLVRSCGFYANHKGIGLIGDGGVVEITDCSFNHMARDGFFVTAHWQSDLLIEDCTFSLWDHHTWPQKHLAFFGVQNAHIRDCTMLEGDSAIAASNGTTLLVERCTFDGQSRESVGAALSTTMGFIECVFENQEEVTYSGSGSAYLSFRRCSIETVSDVAFRFRYVGSLYVNDCDLSGGSRGVVWCEDIHNCTDVRTIDMTGNYWGTTDPDTIAALIRDNTDSDQACFVIDYEPFESESTPTETRSFSGLKSLFR